MIPTVTLQATFWPGLKPPNWLSPSALWKFWVRP